MTSLRPLEPTPRVAAVVVGSPGGRSPVTRTQLVEELYRRHGGLSRRDAQELVDLILRVIRDRLAAGERVDITGFGAFEVRQSAARVGRHPVTGRRFRIVGRRNLVFLPSRVLKDELNAEAS